MKEKKQCRKKWGGERCANNADPGCEDGFCSECRVKLLDLVASSDIHGLEKEGSWPVNIKS